ncbi:GMP synthase [glutamine-hydrolyzing] [Clostridia bacterium]|nr:GMP synthase [glutamine-hydrolyzing] [Clostridia bacterium]
MSSQRIVILNFGGQYCQLIARRVREASVFCEVLPHDSALDDIRGEGLIGIILSGSPASVTDENAPWANPVILSLGVPVLGICYGMQWMAFTLGSEIIRAEQREYGRAAVRLNQSRLFDKSDSICWMSHTYQVKHPPLGFTATAGSANCAVAAMEDIQRNLFAVQFHPEVTHTEGGSEILHRFIYEVCGALGDWSMESYANDKIREIRDMVGAERVLLGLSGGVDSSVAAALISRAIGKQLTCVYIDHGFMRKDETLEVGQAFTNNFEVDFVAVDASERFFADISGISEPETKRKRIGAAFIDEFARQSARLGSFAYLAQGTIYPDVIESGAATGAAVIKSHHNVGGLPKDIGFSGLIEPLRMLFKDEVRRLGIALGLPESLVWRQPFPGPGLAIRVMGEVTPEKVAIVRESDAILRDEIAKAGLARIINQYFTVLTGVRSVGVMGDERTYNYAVAIRAVTTDDFMTGDWARIPHDTLAAISERIVNEVNGVNRVVYDITTKPPASIEWE